MKDNKNRQDAPNSAISKSKMKSITAKAFVHYSNSNQSYQFSEDYEGEQRAVKETLNYLIDKLDE